MEIHRGEAGWRRQGRHVSAEDTEGSLWLSKEEQMTEVKKTE